MVDIKNNQLPILNNRHFAVNSRGDCILIIKDQKNSDPVSKSFYYNLLDLKRFGDMYARVK